MPRGTVKRYLVGVSLDGRKFKFSKLGGALAKLEPGNVMLLQGSDVMDVTKIAKVKGKFVVTTRPASLPEVIKSGRIKVASAVNFRKAFITKLNSPMKARAASTFARPSYPYVDSAARAAEGSEFTVSGGEGAWKYQIKFTPASASRVEVSGTLCYTVGAECGEGGSGLSAEITLGGFIDAGDEKAGIAFNGGKVAHSSFEIDHLNAHVHLTYTIKRGNGSAEGADPPVFRLPFALDETVPVEGIPVYVKIQAAVLLKLGVSSKMATIEGGADVSTAGSEDVVQNGKNVSGSAQGAELTGRPLGDADGEHSISGAPSGVVVAIAFPKVGLGLGIHEANAIAYVDLVSSIGQETGSAFAGMFCSGYVLDLSIGGGVEATLGPFGASSHRREFAHPPPFKLSEPGCPAP